MPQFSEGFERALADWSVLVFDDAGRRLSTVLVGLPGFGV